MMEKVLYLKAEQSVTVSNKKVFIKDVVKIYGEDKKLVKEVSGLLFMTISNTDTDQDLTVSILKVMEVIHSYAHGAELLNLGEIDFILEYRMPNSKKKGLEYAKTAIVAITAFIGAAFTIMTFNTDVSVGQVFQKLYVLVLGTAGEGSRILEISYSIGLTGGILIFYNHFTKKHHNDDPTPIEIEMRTFETDKNNAKIKTASREGKSIDAN